MPTLRHYEAPDVETLLQRIHDELGPSATILELERVRRGGIGGFFAREHVEATVEVAVEVADAPTSVLDLAEAVNQEEEAQTTVSTESRMFSDVLADLVRHTGAAEAAGAQEGRSGGDDARRSAGRDATGPDAPIPAPRPGGRLLRSTPMGGRPGGEDLPAEQDAAKEEDPSGHGTPAAKEPARRVPAPPATKSAAQKRPRASRPRKDLARRGGEVTTAALGRLAALGLPGSLRPPQGATHLAAALRESLATVAPVIAPAPGPGDVVAAVGPLDAATALAREIAVTLAIPPNAVIFASPEPPANATPPWTCLSTPEMAERRRRNLRRKDVPAVVVVEFPVTARRSDWGRRMLAALDVESVWGCVSATVKPEDVAGWVVALGGLDGLALTDLDATETPAALLELAVAIHSLDGRPATPALWSEMLMERMRS